MVPRAVSGSLAAVGCRRKRPKIPPRNPGRKSEGVRGLAKCVRLALSARVPSIRRRAGVRFAIPRPSNDVEQRIVFAVLPGHCQAIEEMRFHVGRVVDPRRKCRSINNDGVASVIDRDTTILLQAYEHRVRIRSIFGMENPRRVWLKVHREVGTHGELHEPRNLSI